MENVFETLGRVLQPEDSPFMIVDILGYVKSLGLAKSKGEQLANFLIWQDDKIKSLQSSEKELECWKRRCIAAEEKLNSSTGAK